MKIKIQKEEKCKQNLNYEQNSKLFVQSKICFHKIKGTL